MLMTRNVRISCHRTSLRFEKDLWQALEEICTREKMSLNDLCTHIDTTKGKVSRSAAVRHYVLRYFRDAATDEGHHGAGHGASSSYTKTSEDKEARNNSLFAAATQNPRT